MVWSRTSSFEFLMLSLLLIVFNVMDRLSPNPVEVQKAESPLE